jgi:uncharacterized membrane protein
MMDALAATPDSLRTAPPAATTAYSPARKVRVDSVDLLRGLVMVIMMLDHTRDYVHSQAFLFDPSDVSKTYPLLFFTRWITHFCAPVFVFLAGTGAYFQQTRGKSKSMLSRFLMTRGFWLIFVELTVLRTLIFFNVDYVHLFAFLQVIWVTGWSMIVLAALIHLPLRGLLLISVGVIALHNLLDGIHFATWNGPGTPVPGLGGSLWMIFHESGVIFPFGYPGPIVMVLYPLIPWVGVMSAGYVFGSLYELDETARRRRLVQFGAALSTGFVVIRAINVYGDPSPWTEQSTAVKTALSFLAVSKYPPSLLYLLMTLGPAMLLLAWLERRKPGRLGAALITYGRVPFFFYVLQWATTHSLAIVASRIAGKPTDYLFSNLAFSPPPGPDSGFGLGMTYFLWLVGVALLYPLCRWYAGVKQKRRDWWLSYL